MKEELKTSLAKDEVVKAWVKQRLDEREREAELKEEGFWLS